MKRLIVAFVFFLLPLSVFAITPESVIKLTNQTRIEHGLMPLKVNWRLNLSAMGKVLSMDRGNYFAHKTPSGLTFAYWIDQAGYRFKKAGENLAHDFKTTKIMQKAFMESKTHKENILNPKYKDIGVAVKGKYVVIHFGYGQLRSCS